MGQSQRDSLVAELQQKGARFQQLRQDMQHAWEDVQFMEQETQQFLQQVQERQQQTIQEQAKEAVKVLSDPDQGIPGWSPELYGNLREFAKTQGMDETVVNRLVDPAAWKMIYAAYQYNQGQQAVKTKSTKKKSPNKSNRVNKTTKNPKSAPKQGKHMSRFKQTGDADDAVEAMLESWGAKE